MRRVALLSVPLLLLMGVVAALITVEAGRPRAWQRELDAYLLDQPGSWSVQMTDWADHPEAFSAELSRTVFGASQTAGDLPFPPEAVWCVLLKPAQGDGLPYRVVFVNRYIDPPWYDEWVVHTATSAPFAPPFLHGLGRLGCDLGREDPDLIQKWERRLAAGLNEGLCPAGQIGLVSKAALRGQGL